MVNHFLSVLGQTTLSRFRGDTVFGLISRIWSTFLGGLVGLVLWYARRPRFCVRDADRT